LQGFRSRIGRPFAAILKITGEHKLEFDFGQNDDADGSGEPIDFSAQTSLGNCPKCAARVFEHGMSYVCEKAVGPEKSCDFKSGKVILQQAIEPEQMQKLLGEAGRTDLLTKFISSRTKRNFKAFLSRGKDGKVGFEFEPRATPAKGKKPVATVIKDADSSEKPIVVKASASKKVAAKKPATKKTASKKPAAKKAVTKKVASKKPTTKSS
jgi:DNA topoisomerase III